MKARPCFAEIDILALHDCSSLVVYSGFPVMCRCPEHNISKPRPVIPLTAEMDAGSGQRCANVQDYAVARGFPPIISKRPTILRVTSGRIAR
jgi:hypothetical protein